MPIQREITDSTTVDGIVAAAKSHIINSFRALMESPIPTLIIRLDRKIVASNSAASRALDDGAFISIGRDGHMRASTATAHRALDAALHLLSLANTTQLQRVVRIDADALTDSRFLIISKAAVVESAGASNGQSAASPLFKITVRKPHRQLSLTEQSLIDGFGLTPTEARLALAVGNGKSLNDFAASTGIRINTVRWHMTNLRRKMATDSQIALVRLLLALDSEE